MAIVLYPPEVDRDGNCCYTFLKSEKFTKPADLYAYSRKIRRVRSLPTLKNEDSFLGTEITWYDFHFHQPWDAEYKILGEDTIEGKSCLVVECKSKLYKDFYLNKWVVWVEKENFLDLHEEHFDKGGRLFKVYDKKWERMPSGHFVYSQWNAINLKTKARSIIQFHNWRLDSGLKEEDFDPVKMTEEKMWRKPKDIPPYIEKPSDLPPKPEIRWEFWNKIGAKPKPCG